MSQSLIDPASGGSSLRDLYWGRAEGRDVEDGPRDLSMTSEETRIDAVSGRAIANWIEGERRARLILSPDLEIVWMNAAARLLRDEGEAFEVDEGRLAPRSPVIAGLVASARPDEPRCAVMPGEGRRSWVAWARQVCAPPNTLIGLTLQKARSETRFQALIDTHFLTRAEGRIIEMLLAGTETGRIAQALDISIETLRTHLKHAYQKMGVRSRGELFAEAISFVGP